MKEYLLKTLLISTTDSVLFGFTGESFAHAQEVSSENGVKTQQSSVSQSQINLESQKLEEGLNSYLGLMERIPDNIANQGIDAAVKWLNQNKGPDYNGYKFIAKNGYIQSVPESNTVITYGTGACVLAVGNAIAQNAIPWAKILKVKKAAKAMGGIQKLVKNIMISYKHQRNIGKSKTKALKSATKISMKAFPKATRQALLEVVSLGGVATACFGL
ncbi:hypothetical protein [Staphylococcus pettenkoferi]|uniref:hypothetical protein n=1 Tax=Staphylococcus pettenkoferi TaxID=170573 RepID=UPI0021B68D45|nr:hypothetical protein [Staphylococcus pettenkoferi]MCY1616551.1 hypothetical protein [Staphylococcus pettenkoferi]